ARVGPRASHCAAGRLERAGEGLCAGAHVGARDGGLRGCAGDNLGEEAGSEMKLVTDALSPTKLMLRIEERLRMRGIRSTMSDELSRTEVPAEVDVWRHFLESLSEDVHADRDDEDAFEPGALRRVRRLLRIPLQPVISSVLRRQVRFNGHVIETDAHLAAEVQRLESEIQRLREELSDSASKMKKAQKALAKAQEEAEKQARKGKKARKAQEAEAEAAKVEA